MDEIFEREFNEMLVEAFHLLLKEEMEFVKSLAGYDLSAREIHLLQGVGLNDGSATVSEVAAGLHITLASTTVLTNRLETEGYLVKRRGSSDGREVLLSLTDKGREIDRLHGKWHVSLVQRITGGMSPFEKEVLLNGVKKLNGIFKKDLSE